MACRREFLTFVRAVMVGQSSLSASQPATASKRGAVYGRIGKMVAVAGQRDALVAILLENTDAMPGCLSYVAATDRVDVDALWITDVWDGAASHKVSLTLQAVQAAIAKGRPFIAGFGNAVETTPIGRYGLPKAAVA
jgi:quinol monooxygenase YgiN